MIGIPGNFSAFLNPILKSIVPTESVIYGQIEEKCERERKRHTAQKHAYLFQ